MSENPLKSMMQSTLEGLKGIADVNTIVGQAVETKDGTVIIPVSKVSLGFGTGGTEYPGKDGGSNPFGGGGGGGVTIDPVAFLVVSQGDVRLMYMQSEKNATVNLVSAIPSVVDAIVDVFSKKKNEDLEIDIDELLED